MNFVADKRSGFDLFVNLTFKDYGVSLRQALDHTGEFLQRLDRKYAGPNFLRNAQRRIDGVFFPEHTDSNLHIHGNAKIGKRSQWDEQAIWDLNNAANVIWSAELKYPGNVLFKTIEQAKAVGEYNTKEYWQPGFKENYFLARQFWSPRCRFAGATHGEEVSGCMS